MVTIRWNQYPAVEAVSIARKWLSGQCILGLALTTIDANARALQDYLTFCTGGAIDPLAATQEQITAYVRSRTHRPHGHCATEGTYDANRDVANATLQRHLAGIWLFYEHLMDKGLRDDNPVSGAGGSELRWRTDRAGPRATGLGAIAIGHTARPHARVGAPSTSACSATACSWAPRGVPPVSAAPGAADTGGTCGRRRPHSVSGFRNYLGHMALPAAPPPAAARPPLTPTWGLVDGPADSDAGAMKVETAAIRDSAARRKESAMDAYTVLVVDDDAQIVEFLRIILEDHGYQVLTAVGAAALCVARERHPDVILLDLMMPGMDGIAVSRHLRADPTTAHIPIIAMSAAKELWAAAGHLAVDELLPKPFHFGDLCEAVARWQPPA